MRHSATLVASFACSAIGGCAKSSGVGQVAGTVIVESEVEPAPAKVGSATITIRLKDGDGKPIPAAHSAVEADMSHPGMSPVMGDAKQAEPGRYKCPVNFTMAGDWVILLHIALADGRKLERQLDIGSVRVS
jgi:YtkA-like